MRIHPLLQDPEAVLIAHTPLAGMAAHADFRRAAIRALAAIRLELDGERIVIKPNVTGGEHIADPESGIGTHPAFVRGMIEYLRAHGAPASRIAIVEDPRNSNDNVPRHWRGTGYDILAAETGVRLHCPTTYTCVKRPVPHPLAHEAG